MVAEQRQSAEHQTPPLGNLRVQLAGDIYPDPGTTLQVGSLASKSATVSKRCGEHFSISSIAPPFGFRQRGHIEYESKHLDTCADPKAFGGPRSLFSRAKVEVDK